jgi:hypothetical protein
MQIFFIVLIFRGYKLEYLINFFKEVEPGMQPVCPVAINPAQPDEKNKKENGGVEIMKGEPQEYSVGEH